MTHALFRARSGLAAAAVSLLLAACASGPRDNIGLNQPQAPAAAGPSSVRTEPVQWKHTKPGCTGECPLLEVDSVAFPGIPALTERVDQSLAAMTGVDENYRGHYQTIAQYRDYFWATAQSRDSTYLKAQLRDVVSDVVGVELATSQYLTGAAHGIPATHFLNWQRSTGRELTLDDMLLPGRHDAYVKALQAAHQEWLKTNEDARNDLAAYNRIWPFQETDNAMLTRGGLLVKYDAYAIAPYSYGQPEITIPYTALQGILKPEFIPAP